MSRVHFKRRRRARLANYAKGGETASNLVASSVVTALKVVRSLVSGEGEEDPFTHCA
jgi:hypothetical protein